MTLPRKCTIMCISYRKGVNKMNKYTASFIISILLSSSAFASSGVPGGNSVVTHDSSHSSSRSASHSTSSSGAASGSASSNSLQGNYGSNNPTTSITNAPASYGNSNDGRIFTGGGNGAPNFFVVTPTHGQYAPGVETRDGQVFVDGVSKSCDNAQRAGLPKCFTIGGQ